MSQLIDLLRSVDVKPTTFLDIGLTALLIYGLFSLIRDTRAVRLVIGVTVLYAVYVAAQLLGLQLLSQILQAGAVVGLFAVVVVFQPELRRALERLGRVGSLGWLLAPSAQGAAERMAAEIARASAGLAADRHGALILIERETGLEDTAETGVMIHADLSAELLRTVFMPRSPLHDGAVIVRGETVLAAGAVIERLSETTPHAHRFGTRHRAALGISEETDALAVVVSEESGAISLVEGEIGRAHV
jgi:diadenylate cyclase